MRAAVFKPTAIRKTKKAAIQSDNRRNTAAGSPPECRRSAGETRPALARSSESPVQRRSGPAERTVLQRANPPRNTQTFNSF